MHMWLSLIALAFTNPAEAIDDLAAAYRQNANSFLSLELECKWNRRLTSDALLNPRAYIEALELLKDPSHKLGPEQMKVHREELPATWTDAEVKVGFANAMIEMERRSLREVEERLSKSDEYTTFRFDFQKLPGRLTIKRWGNELQLSRGSQRARVEHLTSFTGGDFVLIERVNSERWLSLYPFPFGPAVQTRYATVSSTIELKCIVPPFFPFEMKSERDDDDKAIEASPIDEFWRDSGRITSLGTATVAGTAGVHLLCKPVGDSSDLEIAAIDSTIGAMPRWLCRVTPYGEESLLGTVTVDKAAVIAETLDRFRTTNGPAPAEFGLLESICYYEDYERVESAGWYPRSMVLKNGRETFTSARLLTSFTTDDEGSADRNLCTQEEVKTLTVTSIRANASVDEWGPPMVLPAGTTLFDADTRFTRTVDVPVDGLIDARVTEVVVERDKSRAPTKSVDADFLPPRTVIIGINLVVIGAIVLFALKRRARR